MVDEGPPLRGLARTGCPADGAGFRGEGPVATPYIWQKPVVQVRSWFADQDLLTDRLGNLKRSH